MTTLRTQMRSIYSKTGTSRLAELAQMIAKLP
jgi:DNA-binding CsgD family transcriptional regulator